MKMGKDVLQKKIFFPKYLFLNEHIMRYRSKSDGDMYSNDSIKIEPRINKITFQT